MWLVRNFLLAMLIYTFIMAFIYEPDELLYHTFSFGVGYIIALLIISAWEAMK